MSVDDLHSQVGRLLFGLSGLYFDGDELIVDFFVFIDVSGFL